MSRNSKAGYPAPAAAHSQLATKMSDRGSVGGGRIDFPQFSVSQTGWSPLPSIICSLYILIQRLKDLKLGWNRMTLNFVRNICVFWGKQPLTIKFSKFCSESFHHDTDRRCCVSISRNLSDGKSVKSWVILWTKKFRLALKLSLYCADRSQICQGQPSSECSRFYPNRFTFDGVIAERAITAKSPHKVNLIFGWSLYNFQPNNNSKIYCSSNCCWFKTGWVWDRRRNTVYSVASCWLRHVHWLS